MSCTFYLIYVNSCNEETGSDIHVLQLPESYTSFLILFLFFNIFLLNVRPALDDRS
jgi:hypothetical protein